ncbi:MAG: glycoside hydrolase domain-containing protein [Lachnospiraceae bacterium]
MKVPHTEWFHSDCLANYYGEEVFSEEYWRIVENFVKTAVKHRYNMLLTPIFTPPLDTAVGGERRTVQLVDVTVQADGSYAFGFEKLDRWVEMGKTLRHPFL